MRQKLTTDEWVQRLNALGREMDEIAVSLHPSAWHEALAPYRVRWRELVRAKTYDPLEQLRLFDDS